MLKKNTKIYTAIQVVVAAIILVFAFTFLFDLNLAPSQSFLKLIGKQAQNQSEEEFDPLTLYSVVAPNEGYTVDIVWGDTGKKLIQAGGIDLAKYQENYQDPKYQSLISYLTTSMDDGITINKDNAYFWVNTLWALGLTQKSDVLEKGIMGTEYKDKVGNFASTGGWTLGAKDAVQLYSSSGIIPLTEKQQQKVDEISQNIYRPCCGNPTSFPDCNHGMAILGLIELMVSQGKSDEEIYQASLAFNSYWFTQTYVDLAYYFQTTQNTPWSQIDPKTLLSAQYSSGPGYQAIKQEIGNIPGLPTSGGSCGA